tara:strand:+ start:1628 stop:1804 length:177 start_codon:yes stop_codon:yes gene_type:complete
MKDLLDYNRFRIEVMQKKICELEAIKTTLETYVFELCDNACTEDYKVIIKKEIYNFNN